MHRLTALFVTAALASGAATAAELRPIEAHSIHLDGISGTAYYTVEADGYAVIATVASGFDATPVRFTATLLPGQRTAVSVPRELGRSSVGFEIVRIGDRVEVLVPERLASLD